MWRFTKKEKLKSSEISERDARQSQEGDLSEVKGSEEWSIEAALLSILGASGHCFWILKSSQRGEVAQLHGLATSRVTGKVIPIGYNKTHSLRAYHLVINQEFAESCGVELATFRYSPTFTKCLYKGAGAPARWLNAVRLASSLNLEDLHYPLLGITPVVYDDDPDSRRYKNLHGKKLIHQRPVVNSNTVYWLFGKAMGLAEQSFTSCFNRILPGLNDSLWKDYPEFSELLGEVQISQSPVEALELADFSLRSDGGRSQASLSQSGRVQEPAFFELRRPSSGRSNKEGAESIVLSSAGSAAIDGNKAEGHITLSAVRSHFANTQ